MAKRHDVTRRKFLQMVSGSAVTIMFAGRAFSTQKSQPKDRPNFLWISTEDISPDLGCYGDTYAVTPNLDRLAAEGVRYESVFSHAGVCAPTRSGIITGMYPTTLGTCPMRCNGVPPAHVKCFPEYLRAAGYYCTNRSKTDYQFDPPLTAWDDCSGKAHWRDRPDGASFFSIINFTGTHESKIRDRSEQMMKKLDTLGPDERHDPAKAVLPPYYPDTPKVREDWAQYYDIITLMDKQVKAVLDQLEEDGLAEDTIVWFWGDHGRGLPRAKRWIYDSGLRVPLLIRVPKKWRSRVMPNRPEAVAPGTVNDDLIAFIDFAPTMLSLAGIEIPKHIQGQAFLGRQKAQPREYIYAARDRMDEAYDLIRAVRDKRFKYIRNYMAHLSRGQDIDYMNQMPTMQEMRRLHAEGKLEGPQKQYFEPTKPIEELYDITVDPHEVNNLAGDPKYADVLERMRKVHAQWYEETGDIGLIPEPLFDEMKRPGGQYEKTDVPVVVEEKGGTVTLACATAGASMAYRIGGDPGAKTGWKRYVEPITLASDDVLYAKACRLGFKDSPIAEFKLGGPISAMPAVTHTEHWRDKIESTDLRQRLWEVKQLDYAGAKANYAYLKFLKDKYPAVRYWAVIALHANCQNTTDVTWAGTVLKDMLDDSSVVVRIAAAHAMCDWGQVNKGLPVLMEAMKHPTDKARLFALIALNKIGLKARPALPLIEQAVNDSDNYVTRVAKTTLSQLRSQ